MTDKEFNKNNQIGNLNLKLSIQEKLVCLKEINDRFKKILHVYEKSLEPDSKYNYKIYCSGLIIYVSSSNILFNGELVNLVVNLNAILTNKFDKAEIKRIVFESINFINHLYSSYNSLQFLNVEEVNKKGDKNAFN